MPLSVACSSCGAKLRAPDNAVGRTFKCPKCGNQLTVAARTVSPVEQHCSPQTSDVSIKRRAYRTDKAVAAPKVALGFGIASLVLSLIGMVFSVIPCVGVMGIPLSALGLLLGIVGAVFALIRQGRGLGFPLAGSITGLAGLGIAIIWLTVCSGIFSSVDKSIHDAAKQSRDAEPDAMWDRGEKAGAVTRYKTIYGGFWTTSAEKVKMLPRIVEFEVKAGNKDEATTWIKRGLDDRLTVKYTDPAAKELFAAVEKERNEARAKDEAERAKHQAQAEAEMAERRAAREKAKAEEAARPHPSRANYNKIKIGMSLAEVQNILGPGKENAQGSGVLIATWQSKAGFLEVPTIISITFQDNRVQAKAIAP